MMNIDQALEFIHSVSWMGTIPGLERISALLKCLGNPERELKFVHIAGTNATGAIRCRSIYTGRMGIVSIQFMPASCDARIRHRSDGISGQQSLRW